MAQSIKCPTLAFGSSRDLAVRGIEPRVGLCTVSLRFSLSLSLSLSLCPSPPPHFKINKRKKKKSLLLLMILESLLVEKRTGLEEE